MCLCRERRWRDGAEIRGLAAGPVPQMEAIVFVVCSSDYFGRVCAVRVGLCCVSELFFHLIALIALLFFLFAPPECRTQASLVHGALCGLVINSKKGWGYVQSPSTLCLARQRPHRSHSSAQSSVSGRSILLAQLEIAPARLCLRTTLSHQSSTPRRSRSSRTCCSRIDSDRARKSHL